MEMRVVKSSQQIRGEGLIYMFHVTGVGKMKMLIFTALLYCSCSKLNANSEINMTKIKTSKTKQSNAYLFPVGTRLWSLLDIENLMLP